MSNRLKVIDSVELAISRHKPSDDLEVSRDYIGFVVDEVRDAVLSDRLNRIRSNDIEEFYIKRVHGIPVQEEDTPHEVFQLRIYGEIPIGFLQLENSKGIVRVYSDSGREIRRVSWKDLWVIDNLKFAKFKDDNLGYHQEGKNIILHGLQDTYEGVDFIIVDLIPSMVGASDDDKEIYFANDSILNDIEELSSDKILRQLGGATHDLTNDGIQ